MRAVLRQGARKDSSIDLTERKEWLLKMLYEHNDLAEKKGGWVTGLATLLSSLLLYNLGGIKYLVVLYRNISNREFYIKYLEDLDRYMRTNCHDLSFQEGEEVKRLRRLIKIMKKHMKEHKYAIAKMRNVTQVLESFDRHFSLVQTPKVLQAELRHFQARSRTFTNKGFPYFEQIQRFYHNYQVRSGVLPVPPWSTFFPEQLDLALNRYSGLLAQLAFSLAEPSNWAQLAHQSASHLALMAASCQRKHFLPSPESDAYQFWDFIYFFGATSTTQLISEFLVALFLMRKIVAFFSDLIMKCPCTEPGYLWVNVNKLETHRHVERAICTVMYYTETTAAQSCLSQWAQWLFLVIPLVVLMEPDLLGVWYQVTLVAMVLYSLWQLKTVMQDTCGQNSYFCGTGKYDRLLSGLFESLKQQVTISGNYANKMISIVAKPYGSIPEAFMFESMRAALKAIGIVFVANEKDCSLMIENVQTLDPCDIGNLCYRLAVTELDRCVKAQAVRSQLESCVRRIAIMPMIIESADSKKKGDVQFAWQLSFRHIKLGSILESLGLSSSEAVGAHGIAITHIIVENILTPAQFNILKSLEAQQYQASVLNVAHPGGGGVKPVRRRKSAPAASDEGQAVVVLPKSLVPEVTITWPCGAYWRSSQEEQLVVPIRSQLRMLFLVLCGQQADFREGIFDLFQVLVQNGPAIVPPRGASGVVQVPDTDSLHKDHGCRWKLKHIGAKKWRIGIKTEVQLGKGSAQLFICHLAYQKNKPGSYQPLALPAFPALSA